MVVVNAYFTTPDAFISPSPTVSVAVTVTWFVVTSTVSTTGFVLSILSTFPVAAPPYCPVLSLNTAYTCLFDATVIPVLAGVVQLVASSPMYSVIPSTAVAVAVTFTLPFVQSPGSYANVTSGCTIPVVETSFVASAVFPFDAVATTFILYFLFCINPVNVYVLFFVSSFNVYSLSFSSFI